MKILHTALAVCFFAACTAQAAETMNESKDADGVVSIERAKTHHAEMERAKSTLPVLTSGKPDCLKEARTERVASLEN